MHNKQSIHCSMDIPEKHMHHFRKLFAFYAKMRIKALEEYSVQIDEEIKKLKDLYMDFCAEYDNINNINKNLTYDVLLLEEKISKCKNLKNHFLQLLNDETLTEQSITYYQTVVEGLNGDIDTYYELIDDIMEKQKELDNSLMKLSQNRSETHKQCMYLYANQYKLMDNIHQFRMFLYRFNLK